MNAGETRVDIIIEDERWEAALGDVEALAREAARAAAALEPRLVGAVALLFADDAAVRNLNRRFRGRDKPTNVLSFPAGAGGEGALGDIAMAFETCRREADEAGIGFRDHAAHLIVHGLLHLIGYDHEADDEAERMERLEARILGRLGVADPYRDNGDQQGSAEA